MFCSHWSLGCSSVSIHGQTSLGRHLWFGWPSNWDRKPSQRYELGSTAVLICLRRCTVSMAISRYKHVGTAILMCLGAGTSRYKRYQTFMYNSFDAGTSSYKHFCTRSRGKVAAKQIITMRESGYNRHQASEHIWTPSIGQPTSREVSISKSWAQHGTAGTNHQPTWALECPEPVGRRNKASIFKPFVVSG